MSLLNFLNLCPDKGLVKKSPTISSVGQCSTESSFDLILSVTKKCLTLMCLVLLLLEAFPLFSNGIALLLSQWMMLALTSCPCASNVLSLLCPCLSCVC